MSSIKKLSSGKSPVKESGNSQPGCDKDWMWQWNREGNIHTNGGFDKPFLNAKPARQTQKANESRYH